MNRLSHCLEAEISKLQDYYTPNLEEVAVGLKRSLPPAITIIAWYACGEFLKDTLRQMREELEKLPSKEARPMELQDLFFYLIVSTGRQGFFQ